MMRAASPHLGTLPVTIPPSILTRSCAMCRFGKSARRMWLTMVVLATCLSVTNAADRPLHRVIDQHINARLMQLNVPAAAPTSDAEFLRRLSLDLTGTIPDPSTVRAFLADRDAGKRVKLIDRFLASDAYAHNLAIMFDVMLMERRPDKYVTTPEWRDYLARAFAENKPLNILVAEILGADGVDEKLRPAAKFYLDRAVEKDTLVRDIGRLFLGFDLQCAQCHDHPDIDDYLHQHYHGLSVFVAGSKTFKQSDGKFVLQEEVLREVEFASVFSPDKTKKTGPRLLDALIRVPEFPKGEEYVEKPSRTVRSVPKFSLRKLLSERLPSQDTPEFRRNLANRLWAMMLGRGLVHPLYAHHSANPPSHPKLLDALAEHLVATNYDLKAFLREIAMSATYQRSSLIPDGVDPARLPADAYAVATMRGLSPEQLFESLLVATRATAILNQQIEDTLAETKPSAPDNKAKPDPKAVEEARRKQRAARVAEFVTIFGSAPGQPEGEFSSSLPQALFLANSQTFAEWIPPRLGNLAERLVGLNDSQKIADELFLSVLTRFPADEERKLVTQVLNDAGDARPKAIAALVWSQLASAEFRLNH